MKWQLGIVVFGLLLSMSGFGAESTSNKNPFDKYFGEWTLKDDKFQSVWDGKTVETQKIPNHYTECKAINTQQSVLCVVDTADLKGHILWTFDSDKNKVHHLSHFGSSRNGVGTGTLNDKGDLTTRVSFQGEPEGSYRIYEYKWVSENEYSMLSTQYDSHGKPTGNWYGGNFIRLVNGKKGIAY